MKQIKYYVLAGLAMMMLLIGCTEDNSMTEIQKENEPTTGQDIPTDEVLKALSAIPGVYDVQLVTNNNSTGNDGDDNNDDDEKQHRITRSTSSNPLTTTTSSWAPIANTVF